MATNVQLQALAAVVPAAQTSARLWKIPTSITLAQWTLESAWGTSQLARQCRNYFGIKAVQGQSYAEFPTREVVRGRSVTEMAEFARYGTAVDSFAAHAHLLATVPRYKPAIAVATNPAAFARELQLCGYSTSETYADDLMELVREHDLLKYDNPPSSSTASGVTA